MMTQQFSPISMVVWADTDNVGFYQRLCALLPKEIGLVALGGPRTGPLLQWGQEANLTVYDDCRQLIESHPRSIVLLGGNPGLPAEELAELHKSAGVLAASIVPMAKLELWAAYQRALQGRSGGAGLELVPGFLRSPGWTRAVNPQETLGPLRSMVFLSQGRRTDGSLGFRLMDAWMTLLSMGSMPETVDASFVSVNEKSGTNLEDLTGHLHVHIKFAEPMSAVMELTDQAAVSQRSIHLLGEQGQCYADDFSYRLHGIDGKLIDELIRSRKSRKTAKGKSASMEQEEEDWLRLMAEDLVRTGNLEAKGTGSDRSGLMYGQALCCASACLLSCKTGQAESPAKLWEIHVGSASYPSAFSLTVPT